MTDHTLLHRLHEGDAEAFSILYDQYSGKLYSFILKISNNNQYLAEDITQNVFLRVWEMHHEIDVNKSFQSFLSTMAKNMLLNHFKHQMVEFLYQENLASRPMASNSVEEEVDYKMLDDFINSVIEQMPEARRKVFIMSKKMCLSNKEIAARLQISENTVESHLTKADAYIRKRVSSEYDFVLIMIALGGFLS